MATGIEILRQDNDGKLPAYAWPGGYPMYYLDSENAVICPKDADQWDDFSTEIVGYDVNWEDPALFCEHCYERIESAYAEDEAQSA